MDEQQLLTLGTLADKADNFLAWATTPGAPDHLKIDAMKTGLTELSEGLKALYIEVSGTNPWQD